MINPNIPKPTKEKWGQCVPGLKRLEQTILEDRFHALVMRAFEYDLKRIKEGKEPWE